MKKAALEVSARPTGHLAACARGRPDARCTARPSSPARGFVRCARHRLAGHARSVLEAARAGRLPLNCALVEDFLVDTESFATRDFLHSTSSILIEKHHTTRQYTHICPLPYINLAQSRKNTTYCVYARTRRHQLIQSAAAAPATPGVAVGIQRRARKLPHWVGATEQ